MENCRGGILCYRKLILSEYHQKLIYFFWENYERTSNFYGGGFFLPINNNLILEADQLKRSFEEILEETLALSNGIISKEILNSNEIVTKYTLEAETITESLTGISIDKEITLKELNLISEPNYNCPSNLENLVFDLNQRTINLVKEVIQFKEMVLALLLSCNIFAALYPLLIEHILREAHLYLRNLMDLQKKYET